MGLVTACLSHIVTFLGNLLDYRKLIVISIFLELFQKKRYNVTWDLGTALCTAGYLAAQTLVTCDDLG